MSLYLNYYQFGAEIAKKEFQECCMMMNNFTIYKITFSKSKWIEGVKKEKINSPNHDTRLFSKNKFYNESISFDNYCFFFLLILNLFALLRLYHRPA